MAYDFQYLNMAFQMALVDLMSLLSAIQVFMVFGPKHKNNNKNYESLV